MKQKNPEGWVNGRKPPVGSHRGRKTAFPLVRTPCPGRPCQLRKRGCLRGLPASRSGPAAPARQPRPATHSHFVGQPRVRGERHFKGDFRPAESEQKAAGQGFGTVVQRGAGSLPHSLTWCSRAPPPLPPTRQPPAQGAFAALSASWVAWIAPDCKGKLTCHAYPYGEGIEGFLSQSATGGQRRGDERWMRCGGEQRWRFLMRQWLYLFRAGGRTPALGPRRFRRRRGVTSGWPRRRHGGNGAGPGRTGQDRAEPRAWQGPRGRQAACPGPARLRDVAAEGLRASLWAGGLGGVGPLNKDESPFFWTNANKGLLDLYVCLYMTAGVCIFIYLYWGGGSFIVRFDYLRFQVHVSLLNQNVLKCSLNLCSEWWMQKHTDAHPLNI